MSKIKLRIKIKNKNLSSRILLITIFSALIISSIILNLNFRKFELRNNQKSIIEREFPKISAYWASINITNYQINNTRHYHNDTITVEGNLKYNNGTGVKFTEVAIFVDNVLYPNFTGITDLNGDFQVNFTIPFTFNVYSVSGYKIQVNVTDGSKGKVFKENFLLIYAKAASVFDISSIEFLPKIPGEDFKIEGTLRYDNQNGTGIPNVQISYQWFNSSYSWPNSSFFTNPSDGFFSRDIPIPPNISSQLVNLNLSYAGDTPYIDKSNITISNIKLFSDIICIWNVASRASEGDEITIAGQILSRTNQSLLINNRTLILRYDGAQIEIIDTDEEGIFTYNFIIPSGTGNKSIQVNLINTAGRQLRSIIFINITARAPYIASGPGGFPPFMLFSLIFFPILAVVVGVLGVFGYRYYKKQEKESRVISIPLESKFLNLKILKDTGRLEESISYLFNAIYMDLINAKYGRARKVNETIRDFAIISVKEFRLTPMAIYPFIQKVEEIIYAKPFKIKEKDFYDTCELFSPVYFQLTGYNFNLNF